MGESIKRRQLKKRFLPESERATRAYPETGDGASIFIKKTRSLNRSGLSSFKMRNPVDVFAPVFQLAHGSVFTLPS